MRAFFMLKEIVASISQNGISTWGWSKYENRIWPIKLHRTKNRFGLKHRTEDRNVRSMSGSLRSNRANPTKRNSQFCFRPNQTGLDWELIWGKGWTKDQTEICSVRSDQSGPVGLGFSSDPVRCIILCPISIWYVLVCFLRRCRKLAICIYKIRSSTTRTMILKIYQS